MPGPDPGRFPLCGDPVFMMCNHMMESGCKRPPQLSAMCPVSCRFSAAPLTLMLILCNLSLCSDTAAQRLEEVAWCHKLCVKCGVHQTEVLQVDLRNPLQLVSYFANPRWEAALQRTKVALTTTQ